MRFGWVIVPVAIFLTLFGGVRRPGLAVAAFLAFGLVVTPWIIRNLEVSGTFFGTAGYAGGGGTFAFPGSRLMQSVNPDLTSAYWMRPYLRKFLENSRYILQGDLLRIGGSWVAVLFFCRAAAGIAQCRCPADALFHDDVPGRVRFGAGARQNPAFRHRA